LPSGRRITEKQKLRIMQHYELTYIVSIKFIDDELNKIMEKIEGIVAELGGTISGREVLGKQKLAYPLKQIHQGTYVSVEFDMESDKVLKLDTDLKLMGELLRHMIIKKRIKTAEELEREKQVQEKLRKEKEAELTNLEKTEKEEKTEEKTVEVAPKKEDKESKKASLEDLDKKLDEILTDEII